MCVLHHAITICMAQGYRPEKCQMLWDAYNEVDFIPDLSTGIVTRRKQNSMDWQHFRDFLRDLGVEMEDSETQAFPTLSSEPTFTLLQHSRDHEAFYRVDLIDTKPELMVLLPTHDNPLRFHFYLVQQSSTHPLFGSLDRVAATRQESAMEQIHEVIEWHTLQAIVETMKALFWVGLETAQFPHEIVVYKIL